MPSVLKIKAGSGTHPGDARTMPTTAVNTINRLTLGLVSSKKSRQRLAPTTVMGGLSGMAGTMMQGYQADRGRRPKRPQQPHHAEPQKRGSVIVQPSQTQGHAPAHSLPTQANLH